MSVDYADTTMADISVQYDSLGRRTSSWDASGSSTWRYDSLGRLTSTTTGAGKTVGYTWSLGDRLTAIAYPDGRGSVLRAYDDAGRLRRVTDFAGRHHDFSFDANGNVTQVTRPNGVTSTFTFDRTDTIVGASHSAAGNELLGFSYDRGGKGQLESETLAGGAQTAYGYTLLDQLSSAGTATYSHDGADNVTKLDATTLVYNRNNQPLSATTPLGTATFAYDSRGNRTSRTVGTTTTTYGWERDNRLASVDAATYRYSVDGLLTQRIGNATEVFTWHQSGGLPHLLVKDTTAYVRGPNGMLLEQVTGSTATWFLGDQLGSTRALTNASGSVVATLDYDAYGSVVSKTGVADTALRWTGEYSDPSSGFVYLRARWYDPATGQFVSRDPLFAQTRSAYAYVDNNPLNATDPTGELAWLFVALVVVSGATATVATVETGEYIYHETTQETWVQNREEEMRAANRAYLSSGACKPGGLPHSDIQSDPVGTHHRLHDEYAARHPGSANRADQLGNALYGPQGYWTTPENQYDPELPKWQGPLTRPGRTPF